MNVDYYEDLKQARRENTARKEVIIDVEFQDVTEDPKKEIKQFSRDNKTCEENSHDKA